MSEAVVVAFGCVLLGARLRRSPRQAAGPWSWSWSSSARQHARTDAPRADATWASPGVVITVASAVVVLAVVLLGPPGVPVVAGAGGVAVAGRRARCRLVERRAVAARSAAVPDLVDLCRVAASAGTSVGSVLEAVAPRAPGPCRPAVLELLARRDRGEPLAAGLAQLTQALGPASAPLTAALGRSAATGSPLAPLLAEVAAASHDHRRRQAQEAARRLPVTLLFPLTLCVLPAAVVLAVVPVLVVSLHALSS